MDWKQRCAALMAIDCVGSKLTEENAVPTVESIRKLIYDPGRTDGLHEELPQIIQSSFSNGNIIFLSPFLLNIHCRISEFVRLLVTFSVAYPLVVLLLFSRDFTLRYSSSQISLSFTRYLSMMENWPSIFHKEISNAIKEAFF